MRTSPTAPLVAAGAAALVVIGVPVASAATGQRVETRSTALPALPTGGVRPPGAAGPAGPAGGAGHVRPAPLDPPASSTLVAAFAAEGTQVYECLTGPDGSGSWRNRPAAVLTTRGRAVGLHDSRAPQGQPAVPQWTLLGDGSRVVARLAAGGTFPAPDPATAIPALRLDVIENSGAGVLAHVDVVQRDLVEGGVGPTGTCTPGTDTPVVSPYRARYTFWSPR